MSTEMLTGGSNCGLASVVLSARNSFFQCHFRSLLPPPLLLAGPVAGLFSDPAPGSQVTLSRCVLLIPTVVGCKGWAKGPRQLKNVEKSPSGRFAHLVQTAVDHAAGHQLFVGAQVGDAASLHHDDTVGKR